MRKIDLIVIHCTATRIGCPLSPEALDRMHRQRGFNGCGYHYYVRRDGMICSMRPVYGAQNETYIEGWEKKTSNLLIYKRLCKI